MVVLGLRSFGNLSKSPGSCAHLTAVKNCTELEKQAGWKNDGMKASSASQSLVTKTQPASFYCNISECSLRGPVPRWWRQPQSPGEPLGVLISTLAELDEHNPGVLQSPAAKCGLKQEKYMLVIIIHW